MSFQSPEQVMPETAAQYEHPADRDGSVGWVLFAGVLLLTIGTTNVIEGIAAISNAHFFTAHAHYIAGSLNTWGWIALCLGLAQLVAAGGIFVKNQLARWFGVAVLGLNAIAQLLMMPAYPFWGLCLFAVDILALYGLVAHGQRATEAW